MMVDFDIINYNYYNLLFCISHILAMSSTVYNPFLYWYLNDDFHQEFQRIMPFLSKICPCINRNRSRIPISSNPIAMESANDCANQP
ncbi:unnamed protein product [Rotaria sp. Silwood2]|nr:unnamed protein product [Rotaria sp. Silwood2]CAF4423880.1 unnamed protein product [Rotaria sp. Silwood2]